MTDHQSEIHRSQTSSRAFLYSKTEKGTPDAPAEQPSAEASTDPDGEAAPDQQEPADFSVTRHFPEALTSEQALMEAAMVHLAEVSQFSALLIRVDAIHNLVDPDAVVGDAAAVIDELCNSADGLWGMVDAHVFGCFLPAHDEAACRSAADTIKQKLAERRAQTVTIGMAVYPTLEYDKADILSNAKKAVDHAEFFGPDSAVAFDSVSLNISGDQYYQAGDIDGAISEFHLALALDPANVNVHNSLGVCYGVKGDTDRALASFQAAIERDPEEQMALYNAGYAHMLKGEYEKALTFFQRAEKIDADIFELNFQTGRVLFELGQTETARTYLEHAVSIKPDAGIAYRYLGDCYAAADHTADAVNAYKTALKRRPDDADAISALGYSYEILGQNAEIALMFSQQATEMAPENGLFHYRLGWIYQNRNQPEQAAAAFENARECGYDTGDATGTNHRPMENTDEKHHIQQS